MKTCSVVDCGKKAQTKGLCSKHYQRLLKRGSVEDYLGCHEVDRKCSVEGCGGKVDAKGLCNKHYLRLKIKGTIEDSIGSHAPLSERFFRFVDKSGDCWIWKGKTITQKGYGLIQSGGKGSKHKSVHRLSYEMHIGEITAGLVVMHKCDNPSCVNPDHLELGTQSKNIKDAIERGRKISKPPHKFGESHGASKLTELDVREIRGSSIETKELARKFGVSKTTIERVRNRKTWSHIK